MTVDFSNQSQIYVEAHRVALFAVAHAFDLEWDEEGSKARSVNSWPRFSNESQDEDRTPENRRLLDAEQVYFQAFVIDRCLQPIRSLNSTLAGTVLETWDGQLKKLQEFHGIAFRYDTCCHRRFAYNRAWKEPSKRLQADPEVVMVENPIFWIAVFLIEEVCGLRPDALTILPITNAAIHMANSFIEATENWIVVRE